MQRHHRRRHAQVTIAIAIISLLGLGACGGGHPPVAPLKVAGHQCSPRDTAMQCVLANQPQSREIHRNRLLQATVFGWDFAWSCPSPVGRSFGASYLSFDFSKNWTRACVAAYHAHGAGTVAVWEAGATRSEAGFNAGFSDARSASAQLAALGAPAGQPFDMAIDFDANGPEVAGYFQGANAAEPGRINDYGGYRPTLWLYNRHLVGNLNWQTYAWSGGQWLPASIAPLEQFLNSSAVDYDRAIAPNYGQWPPPAPPGPSPDQVRRWVVGRGASLHAYYRRGCHQPVLTNGACGQFGWRVDHYQNLIDTAHGYYPRCFGKHANLHAAECQIVRPAVAVWSRARSSTVNAGFRLGCQGIATWGLPKSTPVCKALGRRYAYFNRRAGHTVATSRY